MKNTPRLFFYHISLLITHFNEYNTPQTKKLSGALWHFYHLFWGFPSLDFSQLRKMKPALAFNFMIAASATNAWIGKWNRHNSNNFFYPGAILKNCKKIQKMKIDYVHCPMRKFWRTSLRPFGQNNVRISKKWDRGGLPGEGCTSLPRVKPGWNLVCLHCTSSWGAPMVKMEVL